jgi:hypothetical protein
MKVSRTIAVSAAAALAVACNQSAPPPPPEVQDDDGQVAAPAGLSQAESIAQTLATSRPVELPVSGDNEALFLAEGETVRYQARTPDAGGLNGVGIQIGNFGGGSEGSIRVNACQQGECAEGTAALAGSVDNAFLPVAFEAPLEVTEGPLEIAVTRSAGYNPFAVWSYPAESEMTLPDGSQVDRSLRAVLYYQVR